MKFKKNKKLRRIRKALNVSQGALASAAGLAAWRIAWAEQGLLELTALEEAKLLQAFPRILERRAAEFEAEIASYAAPAEASAAPEKQSTR